MEAVRFPLVVLTPDLRVKSANAAFYDTFQVTRDETEGVLLSELDNQQWNIPELLQLLTKVLLENEEVAGFEIEHDFEQIGRRTMLVYARPLDGAPLILVGMVDLTERKRAEAAVRAREQRLRKILETEAVGVLFFDKQGSVVDANGVFLRMTGYSRGEIEARELTWRKMTPPEWVETSEEQMRKLETTGHLGPYEKECLLKDGSRSWMLFAGADLDDGTIVEYCVEIGDRKRAEEDRELLTRELSHRVKNLLAVVQALAIQTDGRIQSVDAYRESFVGRLQALARSHALLIDANWRSADLKTLIEQAVAAYRVDRPEQLLVEGEPVTIAPKQALGLSLVLHELGTNAAKYGAMSQQNGRLRIFWQIEGDDSGRRVRLRWEERDVPRTEEAGEKGFGTELMERACTYELDGEVELTYEPQGLSCEIVFPLEQDAL